MSHPVTIVTLSKYREVFEPFIESWIKFASTYPLVVVADGSDILEKEFNGSRTFILAPEVGDREVQWIDGPKKFAMAGNGNIGLKAVSADHDILYVGDDVRFLQENTIEKLQEVAYSSKFIGLVSPRIVGRGSPVQCNPPEEYSIAKPLEFWFPCVYIKREIIEKIGYLDERFNDFGSDDLDYCIRVKQAGYQLIVARGVSVEHEASPEGGPTTFVRKLGVQEYQKQQAEALEKLREKYGVSPEILGKSLVTGDCNILKPEANVVPEGLVVGPKSTKEEQLAYLRTRHIFIATPAYGGWLAVNYINSMYKLRDLCRDIGINLSIHHMYNDSLITRIRNSMVDDFLKRSEATDLFFIDADIGFDPKDVVSLLFHPEEIVSAPCSKKELRLDRVYKAGMEGKGPFSKDDMERMLGQFVLNFIPGQQPTEFNLGQMLEVMDAGTGFMRVKREVFGKFSEFWGPDRMYLPLVGEDTFGGPMYMYFQAEIDADSATVTGQGLPQYISEDYSFCRRARKAGMKVWIAPWIKTSHFGSYHFQGDLEAVAKSGGGLR